MPRRCAAAAATSWFLPLPLPLPPLQQVETRLALAWSGTERRGSSSGVSCGGVSQSSSSSSRCSSSSSRCNSSSRCSSSTAPWCVLLGSLWRSIRCVSTASQCAADRRTLPIYTVARSGGNAPMWRRSPSTHFVTTSCRTCPRVELVCVTALSLFFLRIKKEKRPRTIKLGRCQSAHSSPMEENPSDVLCRHMTKSCCVIV